MKAAWVSAFVAIGNGFSPLAFADVLSPQEILNTVSGDWSAPHIPKGQTDYVEGCDLLVARIWVEAENGGWRYYSRLVAPDEVGEIATASVTVQHFENGATAPWILIEYDGEDRTTDTGEVVQWRLIMLSEDQFVWQRSDWGLGEATPIRNRCETPVPVS